MRRNPVFWQLLTPEMGGTHVDLAVVTEEHGYAASSLPSPI